MPLLETSELFGAWAEVIMSGNRQHDDTVADGMLCDAGLDPDAALRLANERAYSYASRDDDHEDLLTAAYLEGMAVGARAAFSQEREAA